MPQDWPPAYTLTVVVVIAVVLGGHCSMSITSADMYGPQGEAMNSTISPYSQYSLRVKTLASVLTPLSTSTLTSPLPGPSAAVLTVTPFPGTMLPRSEQPMSTSSEPSKPKPLPSLSDLNLWHYLPQAWSSFCTVDYDKDPDVNVTITCRIPPSKDIKWRLADLRTALSPLDTALKLQVSVSLRCDMGGTVSLPLPFRCPALVKLSVNKCLMVDKYADFMTPAQELPNWLKWQEIRNCTWLVTSEETDRLIKNADKITSHFDCGQDSTLTTYIYSNILDQMLWGSGDNKDVSLQKDEHTSMTTAVSEIVTEHVTDHVTTHMSTLVTASTSAGNLAGSKKKERTALEDEFNVIVTLDGITSHCFFGRLEVHDESYNIISGLSHLEYLTKNSRFPKLRLLNFTGMNFLVLPQEIRQPRRTFWGSKLGVIDLSYNNVTEVSMIDDYPSNINLTLILRHNSITVISYKMFKEWAKDPNLYVDIRDNPISCDCSLEPLIVAIAKSSLWQGRAMAYYLHQLSLIKCATPSELKGRAVASLGVSELPCPVYRVDLTPALAGLAVLAVVLLVALVIVIYYRKKVRILIYSRKHIVWPWGLSSPAAEKQDDAVAANVNQV